MTKYIVTRGCSIESKTNYRMTPLLIAAEYGHFDILKYLVDCGANVNAKNDRIYYFYMIIY